MLFQFLNLSKSKKGHYFSKKVKQIVFTMLVLRHVMSSLLSSFFSFLLLLFFFFLFPCFLVFVGRRTVSNLVGTSCSSSIESKKPIFLLFLFFVCGSLTGIEPIATCLQLLCVLVQAVESVFSCFSCFQLFLFPTFLVFFFF